MLILKMLEWFKAARLIIPIKRSSKWMVVVKIVVAVLKCVDVKENSLKMY